MSDPRQLLEAYAVEEALNPALKAQGVPTKYGEIATEAFAALRAVLDVHKPDTRVIDQWTRCRHCNDSNGDGVRWPCDTAQTIAKALGEH